LIQEKVFACVFDTLRSVAEASCFSYFAFALRYTELCGFADKNFQTVESTVKSKSFLDNPRFPCQPLFWASEASGLADFVCRYGTSLTIFVQE
jgi:hypothetical protein